MNDAKLFCSLGNETRLEIVKILLKGERCACELPKLVGKAQPTVSLQLKKLVSAGVLSFKREGTKCIYRVSNPKIAKVLRTVK